MYEVEINDGKFIEKSAFYDEKIKESIDFLCNGLSISRNRFNVRVIFALNYDEKIKKYHFKPDKTNTSNGITIPWFHLKKWLGLLGTVIVINNQKIIHTDDQFITSVLIHEMVHYLDYLECSNFTNKYKVEFNTHHPLNTIGNVLIGFFQTRSEMRAKYFQEKYMCIHENIAKRIDSDMTKINNNNIFYELAHLRGQIHCWKEYLSQTDQYDLIRKVQTKENEINERYKNIKNLEELFEIDDLYNFFDKEISPYFAN